MEWNRQTININNRKHLQRKACIYVHSMECPIFESGKWFHCCVCFWFSGVSSWCGCVSCAFMVGFQNYMFRRRGRRRRLLFENLILILDTFLGFLVWSCSEQVPTRGACTIRHVYCNCIRRFYIGIFHQYCRWFLCICFLQR